jgi:rfaE bifunctional protein kinase chain/domain
MEKKRNNDYRRKIKTRDEVLQIIGPRPRSKSVIMCHGTFDIVHPGHIRHLLYARDKADILIASLTCDAHIKKANFRPFVPEQLRTMNLAALEMVDYVIVDYNPTPLENLQYLQPDYFAKGYEYSHQGIHPKTQEEMAVLDSYGGEIIFTPGDIVYSSSTIIESAPPNISAEKLVTLMDAEQISFDQLRETLTKFNGIRIHVIGDTIVDTYTYCSLIGSAGKTPTFSVKYHKQIDFSGGAAIVSKHVRSAGAHVIFSTVMGEDPLKEFVLKNLEASGVECRISTDHTRPTTQKNVIIADGYRMLKVDKVDNRTVSEKIVKQITQSIATSKADAYIFSDFRHGVFTHQTIPEYISAVPLNAIRVADSQVASRWGNILEFQGFDLITPNEREARFSLGDQDSVVRPLALELYKRARCKYLILKLGEKGIITYRSDVPDNFRAFFTLDSFAERVIDPVGAGDALLAYSTLALIVSKSEVIAAILGSMAAAIACEQDGNIPISPDQVLEKINVIEKRIGYQ